MSKSSLIQLQRFKYKFIKTFLHAVYNKIFTYENLEITHFAVLESNCDYSFRNLVLSSKNDEGVANVDNDCIYTFIKYKGKHYNVSVSISFEVYESLRIRIEYWLGVVGSNEDANCSQELAEFIVEESFKHCLLKNKLIKITFDLDRTYEIDEVNINSLKYESLDSIFLSQKVKFELNRFCRAVENYKATQQRLRFLLSGEPGTGKTKAVSAIIHKCYGKATIIFINGFVYFNELFEIANYFSPSIVCLDDVDLLVSSRDKEQRNEPLGTFLNALDGIIKNDVFVLATTNDKTLVDNAARRPGRFDMILDFTKLDSKSYLDLIKDNCKFQNIINLFDDEMLLLLKNRKVTGAYLVNLLKQLELQYKLDNETNLKEYLNNLIDLTYQGFYKKTEERQFEFGFNGS